MQKKESNIGKLESFILEWNIDFPVDRWWREKHKVAFNSASHREVSFLDMYWEFYEDSLYQKMISQKEKKDKDPYIPGFHDFLFESQKENNQLSEEEFDKIEI